MSDRGDDLLCGLRPKPRSTVRCGLPRGHHEAHATGRGPRKVWELSGAEHLGRLLCLADRVVLRDDGWSVVFEDWGIDVPITSAEAPVVAQRMRRTA